MTLKLSHAFVLAVAVAASVAPPALALDGPKDLIHALYARRLLPMGRTQINRFLARDLAAAYGKDGANPDEVGAIDFDWRYSAQDMEITALTLTEAKDAKGATVVAHFKNFGKPGVVTYRLCIARKGWRIAVARGGDAADAWDLREMLKLPAAPVRC
jgi:hypothetical protein